MPILYDMKRDRFIIIFYGENEWMLQLKLANKYTFLVNKSKQLLNNIVEPVAKWELSAKKMFVGRFVQAAGTSKDMKS